MVEQGDGAFRPAVQMREYSRILWDEAVAAVLNQHPQHLLQGFNALGGFCHYLCLWACVHVAAQPLYQFIAHG
jgi:hypothetical protein